MNLTKEQLLIAFDLACTQRESIDKGKCETFGAMRQGFLSIKKGDNAHLVPFLFSDEKSLQELRNYVAELETAFLGVSFVQHYIHYT